MVQEMLPVLVILLALATTVESVFCTANNYPCLGSAKHCIPPGLVCNDAKDCPLGDDEFFCKIPDNDSCSLPFPCPTSNTCTNFTSVCDGSDDCPGRGDELGCDLPCPAQCMCGGYIVFCVNAPWNAASASWVSRETINLLAVNLQGDNSTSTHNNSVQDVLHLDFSEFKNLKILSFIENRISRLQSDSFVGLNYVHTLIAYDNQIATIQPLTFKDMKQLRDLYLSENLITDLLVGAFSGLKNLEKLHLQENRVSLLPADVFVDLSSLQLLNLINNTIVEIKHGAFRGLRSLQHLFLGQNKIKELVPGVFQPLRQLQTLHLDGNRITFLANHSFIGLFRLQYLDISENPLTVIGQGSFIGLSSIHELYMVTMDVEVIDWGLDMFHGLESLHSFTADDHRFCCLLNTSTECQTPPSPFATCEGLLRQMVLRMFIWILGLSAVVGNIIVIIWRFRERKHVSQNKIQILLIMNLAISDLLMGVYMIMIGSADGYFGQDYFLYATEWRSSAICKTAGIISVLASVASMLIVTVISVDRFLCVVFPFGSFRLGVASARVTVVVVWVVSAFLSLLPNIIEKYVKGFYGLSDVCVGLPLATKSDYKASWHETEDVMYTFSFDELGEKTPASYYAIFLFIVVSLVCFLVILASYIGIFVSVRHSSKGATRQQARDEEVKMAIKMALIVGTDFACWMPIIIMGLLSQTGAVTIPVETYAWTMVFVLPINSSINPYLYTISTLMARRLKGSRKGSSQMMVPLSSAGKNSNPPVSDCVEASTNVHSCDQKTPIIQKA
ncbi:G-protein coupled receptor GRL101-like [Asterias rubens]|uniref:G-protein coupled receptor GRL101-like n=1 Tax=Asterias rubens TaxID=7604 RepID=UPI001455985E|nr:G-protein coupled receptor GRL101-like [Asterias rubens]